MCAKPSEIHDKPVNTNRAGIYVYWGVTDVIRKRLSGETVSEQSIEKLAEPVYDHMFDLSDQQAQMHILRACDRIMRRDDLVQPHSERCFMRSLKLWAEDRSMDFPIKTDDHAQFTRIIVSFLNSGEGKKFIGYIGLDDAKQPTQVLWVSLWYYTNLKPYDSGFSALAVHSDWTNLIDALNVEAPSTANKAFQSTDLWPRMFTEVIAVTGTLYSIIIVFIVSFALYMGLHIEFQGRSLLLRNPPWHAVVDLRHIPLTWLELGNR